MKPMKPQIQGPSFALAPSMALGGALNKYSHLFLTLYPFHKMGPKIL
jgi:hypothetical protein